MKVTDKIAQRIQSTGIAVGVVILGITLFMNTVGSATASTPKQSKFDFPDELSQSELSTLSTSSGGRYEMQFQALRNEDGAGKGYVSFYVLVWDNDSGRSKMYYGSTTKGSIVAAGDSFNLPSSPL